MAGAMPPSLDAADIGRSDGTQKPSFNKENPK
jgi:hypothetical protein